MTTIISYTLDTNTSLFNGTVVNNIDNIDFKTTNVIINTTNDINMTHKLNDLCFKHSIA